MGEILSTITGRKIEPSVLIKLLYMKPVREGGLYAGRTKSDSLYELAKMLNLRVEEKYSSETLLEMIIDYFERTCKRTDGCEHYEVYNKFDNLTYEIHLCVFKNNGIIMVYKEYDPANNLIEYEIIGFPDDRIYESFKHLIALM